MNSVLVIAPHPDDETLGCGGALLKHKAAGDTINWLIFSRMTEDSGFGQLLIDRRKREIELVKARYGFSKVILGQFDAMSLDRYPKKDLIDEVSRAVQNVSANILYVPFRLDAHSDHAAVFDAAAAIAKSFRYPSIRSVRAYETLSETDFGLRPEGQQFKPNLFISIDEFLEEKIEIMKIYQGEMAPHPFPRSEASIRALATLRGTVAGSQAAEAFMLLREIW